MANITGTNGKDILTGTAADDTILGLGGNDIIISSGGSDNINGGAGNDTVDYSSLPTDYSFLSIKADGSLNVGKDGTTFRDDLVNIETIIAKPVASNTDSPRSIIGFFQNTGNPTIDVDLSKNKLTYSSPSFGTKTITVKNYYNVTGGNGVDRIKGDDSNNLIEGGGGNDTIVASKGNDNLNGLAYRSFILQDEGNANTVDYSDIGRAVTLNVPTTYGNLAANPRAFDYVPSALLKVNKGDFGTDTITGFQKIIGTTNRVNTLDASTAQYGTKLDVNLATNTLSLTVPFDGIYDTRTQTIEVVNFVNIIGGQYNDTIVGGNKNSTLTGGGGIDRITGGSKNDIITGSSSTARGVGEVDTLTGGGGKDKFVLGDNNGAYYLGNGNSDYALITDFDLFQDSINIGSLKDYSFALEGTNTIDLYSGKDVNTRDLIAKIQISSGISTVSSSSRSIAGFSSSLDTIVAKIDILSGSTSEG
jgi:Ca2+-binding RTX toxin-like protein